MEKQNFLIYLGVGFVITLGVWGLIGGFSSSEEKQAGLEELPLIEENLKVPEKEPLLVKRKESVLPIEEKVIPQSLAQKVVKEKPPVKIVEKVRIVHYKVGKGDTLWGISRKYGTVIEDIVERNNLKDLNVFVGQKLKIKTKVLVKVEAPIKIKRVKIKQPQVKEIKIVKKEGITILPVVREKKVVKTVTVPLATPKPASNPKALHGALHGALKESGPRMDTFTGALLTHEVKNQESLEGIATEYKTSMAFLQDINGLTASSQVHAGQILLVPEK